MTNNSLSRRAARQLTPRRLFPIAMALVLLDLFWTTAMHPWLPETNPVAAWLSSTVGWTGVGVIAVAVVFGIFELYRRLPEPFGRIGATSVTTVLAGPALWNTSLYVRLDGWSTLWRPVFETTATVALVAAFAWLVYERELIQTTIPVSANTVRSLTLVMILVVSLPAASIIVSDHIQQEEPKPEMIAEEDEAQSIQTLAASSDYPYEEWSTSFSSANIGVLHSDGDHLYIGYGNGYVGKRSLSDGSEEWNVNAHTTSDTYDVSDVATSPNYVLSGESNTNGGTVTSINKGDGSINWEKSVSYGTGGVAYNDGVMYVVTTNDPSIDAYDADTGDLIYSGSSFSAFASNDMDYHDGYLYVATGSDGVHKVDPADGSSVGAFEPDGSGGGDYDNLESRNGVMYLGSTTGEIVAVSTSDLTEQWRTDLSDNTNDYQVSGISVGKNVVHASIYEDLYSLDVSTGSENYRNDQFHGDSMSAIEYVDGSMITGSDILDASKHVISTAVEEVDPVISGTVTKKEDGTTFADINVTIESTSNSNTYNLVTDADGFYQKQIPADEYNVTADSGIDTNKTTVDLQDDTTVNLSVAESRPTVSGNIKAIDSDEGLNATIRAESGVATFETETNSDGSYTLPVDPDGYELTAETSFDSANTTVTVENYTDNISGIDFSLMAGDIGGTVISCEIGNPRCSDGNPVSDATVELVTLNHTSIQEKYDDINSAAEARQKAEEIEEKLEVDPKELVPDEFDEWKNLSPEQVETKLEQQEGTVVAAHDERSWAGYDGRYIRSDVPFSSPSPKPPQMQFLANEKILLSVWDPGENADTTPDEELGPGNSQTGDIKIEVEELGPTGSDTTSRVNTPNYLEVDEGFLGRNKKTLKVAQWQADPGIYALSPENSEARTIIKVGSQDAENLYQGYVPPNEDELKNRSQHFKDIANKFENYSADNIVDTVRTKTGPRGRWDTDVPDAAKTVGITAYKGDGDLINPKDPDVGLVTQLLGTRTSEDAAIPDTSQYTDLQDLKNNFGQKEEFLGDVEEDSIDGFDSLDEVDQRSSELEQELDSGFDGKVHMPTDAVRADVPTNETVTIRTVRLSGAPFGDSPPGLSNEELDKKFEDWLNSKGLGLFEEFGLDPQNESFAELTAQYEDLRELANQAPEDQLDSAIDELSDEQIKSIVGGEIDAPESGQYSDAPEDREEMTRRLNEMEAIVDTMRAGQQRTDPVEIDITTTDNPDSNDLQEAAVLSGEFPFPGEINEDSVTARVEYADGTSEPIPEEEYSIGSAGGTLSGIFNGAEKVVITAYEVPADKPSPALRVDAVVDSQDLMTSRGETTNPQYSGEIPRFDAVGVSALSPDPGETVEMTPRLSDDVAEPDLLGATVIKPDGSASNASIEDGSAIFTPQSAGSHTVEFEYQNAAGDIFIERASVDAKETLAGTPPTVRVRDGDPPLAGNGIDSARLETNDGTVELLAQANANRDISELHVREADALSGERFELEVVEGAREERVDSYVSTTIYDDVPEDALLWRNGDQPIAQDGNEYGKVQDERIRTYTRDDGTLTVRVVRDPGPIERADHWVSLRTASLPGIGIIGLWDIALGVIMMLLSLGGGYAARGRIRGVLA